MTSTDEHNACSSRLTVDLDALRHNYRTIATTVSPARCSAVVKANAYGLGVAQVVPALYREGCRIFFVAQLCEAAAVKRAASGDITLFILNGLDPGSEATCADSGFIPVLNSALQVARWRALARQRGRALPAALQVDSGMSRLGLPLACARELAADQEFRSDVDLQLLMTHLACADEPGRPVNDDQLAAFASARQLFPDVPASIANSGGSFLPPSFHLDIVRPGIALYGGSAGPLAHDIRAVVQLEARVVQCREIAAGTGVGYGLTHVAARPERLATIAIGYADGWPRCLGNKGSAWRNGTRLPFVGRVSMDSTIVDTSTITSGALNEGDFVELIGPSQSLDQVAADAGTISYEILTQLGRRHHRIYTEEGRVHHVPAGEWA